MSLLGSVIVVSRLSTLRWHALTAWLLTLTGSKDLDFTRLLTIPLTWIRADYCCLARQVPACLTRTVSLPFVWIAAESRWSIYAGRFLLPVMSLRTVFRTTTLCTQVRPWPALTEDALCEPPSAPHQHFANADVSATYMVDRYLYFYNVSCYKNK